MVYRVSFPPFPPTPENPPYFHSHYDKADGRVMFHSKAMIETIIASEDKLPEFKS